MTKIYETLFAASFIGHNDLAVATLFPNSVIAILKLLLLLLCNPFLALNPPLLGCSSGQNLFNLFCKLVSCSDDACHIVSHLRSKARLPQKFIAGVLRHHNQKCFATFNERRECYHQSPNLHTLAVACTANAPTNFVNVIHKPLCSHYLGKKSLPVYSSK